MTEIIKGAAVQASSAETPIEPARQIPDRIRLHLFVSAGGRCQFAGCNCDLMQHHLTQTKGNFAEMAHIVAFKIKGPRGNEGERPEHINAITNLMLLCAKCHKLIDDNPNDYPREMLESFKMEHETRIKTMTEIGPEMRSAVLVFAAPIRGQEISVREDHVRQAMLPYYPVSSKGTHVDLSSLRGQEETPEFLEMAKTQIERAVSSLFDTGSEANKASHLSIFGIGPMVQLMMLGAALSNKVPANLYQRHRDTEDWKWKHDGTAVQYKLTKIKEVNSTAPVALVLALSGTIPLENLPRTYQDDASIYKITLDGQTPTPIFLRQRTDLEKFRFIYLQALGLIAEERGLVETVSVFPAIPAPVAILCGRERLPKVHPRLRVYDFDHASNGFLFQAEVG